MNVCPRNCQIKDHNSKATNNNSLLISTPLYHICSEIVFFYCKLAVCLYVDTATSAASCRKSLGMHSGVIPDEAITASSSYDSVSVGPAFGRFLTTTCFWCVYLSQSNNSVSCLCKQILYWFMSIQATLLYDFHILFLQLSTTGSSDNTWR